MKVLKREMTYYDNNNYTTDQADLAKKVLMNAISAILNSK